MSHILEICCSSLEACRNAQSGGADRIELCGSMAAGGLTPSIGLFHQVIKHCTIPIAVMIRPRGAGFCYSEDDIAVMKADASYFLEHGASAIVFGCLTKNREIDTDHVKEFCDLAHSYGKEAVFHRAIDECFDIIKQIHILHELGIDRVLTAGGSGDVSQHIDIVKEIVQSFDDKLQIIICGGIRSHNVDSIVCETKVKQIHSACRVMKQDASMEKEEILTYANAYDSVDPEEVQKMVKLKSCFQ